MVNMYSKPTDSPKKKTKPNIHYKSLNQKPQITKSNITKANLKTKTSTEQRNQHCNTSQQTDRASPHWRLVSQHNLSSSPEHIASRFGHRRSPIGHVARRSACSSAPLTSTSRYFITSLFFSL